MKTDEWLEFRKNLLDHIGLWADDEIKELLPQINRLVCEMTDLLSDLNNRIKFVQDACSHSYCEDNFYDNPNRNIFTKSRIFVGKTCTRCGFFIPRKIGHVWQVCHRCGGDMVYDGKTPGQGGDGEHFYHCKNCNHEVSHT